MGILGQRSREVVEEGLHDAGEHLGQHEGEVGAGGRAPGAEQVGPLEAAVAQPARALAAHPPAEPCAALLADAGFVHEPELDPLARVRLGRHRQRVAEPPLMSALSSARR
jgi:hypothetical protein